MVNIRFLQFAVNDDMCIIKIILNERKKVKLKKKEKYVKDKGKKAFLQINVRKRTHEKEACQMEKRWKSMTEKNNSSDP